MAFLKFDRYGDFLSLKGFDDQQLLTDQAARYKSALPFAHAIIDDFIDREILQRIASEFPSKESKTFFDRDQERFKYQFHPKESSSILTRSLLNELNSDTFLKYLTRLTGITNLFPDPYFLGGGLHETLAGGHLSVHADFNIHQELRAQRRLNLLVYLNDDWLEDFGGNLELWSKDMRRCEVSVAPVLGRAVVFSTDSDSFHGQPEPLTCPESRTRKSIALYYYSVPPGGIEQLRRRTTQFQVRPNANDKADWKIRVGNLLSDWTPPRLQPLVGKVFDRL